MHCGLPGHRRCAAPAVQPARIAALQDVQGNRLPGSPRAAVSAAVILAGDKVPVGAAVVHEGATAPLPGQRCGLRAILAHPHHGDQAAACTACAHSPLPRWLREEEQGIRSCVAPPLRPQPATCRYPITLVGQDFGEGGGVGHVTARRATKIARDTLTQPRVGGGEDQPSQRRRAVELTALAPAACSTPRRRRPHIRPPARCAFRDDALHGLALPRTVCNITTILPLRSVFLAIIAKFALIISLAIVSVFVCQEEFVQIH